MSRPFGDPIFNDWDHASFARKWSTDQRTEMEVVTRRALTPAEIQAFVCVANGVWSDVPQKSPHDLLMMRPTDTLVDQASLLDRTEEDGRMVAYTRSIESGSPLAWVASQMFEKGLPQIDWPMKR
jgi:hypothetical protein